MSVIHAALEIKKKNLSSEMTTRDTKTDWSGQFKFEDVQIVYTNNTTQEGDVVRQEPSNLLNITVKSLPNGEGCI